MNAESSVTTPCVSSESAPPAIEICDVWKSYRTGVIRGHTLIREFESLLARLIGRADPNNHVLDRGAITTEATGRNVRFWAVQGVSFSVAKGEVVALLGRNGAGKSTLLQILCRITEADRGVIRIRGRLASLLGAGVGFNDELTGRENVFLNGSILGMQPSEIESRIASIAEFAEIPEFMDTPVKRYSNGMRARLGFSVAVHLDADIMILDEVFATGDRVFRNKCIDKMKQLAQSGRTILIVTHMPEMLKSFCKRGVVIANGTVVFDGDMKAAMDLYMEIKEDGDKGNREDGVQGNGKLRVDVCDQHGERISSIDPAGGIVFDVEYEALNSVEKTAVVVSIRHATHGLVCRFETPAKRGLDLRPGERMHVVLTIPSLPLGAAVKELECRVGILSKLNGSRVVDFWTDSYAIESAPGKTLNQGVMSCPHDWKWMNTGGAL